MEILRNAICYIEALEKILNSTEPPKETNGTLHDDDILSSHCINGKVCCT